MRVARAVWGVDTRRQVASNLAVADEQGLDEVARLLGDGDGGGVWRIVGGRPNGEASCEVEFLVLCRADDDRYRLRSVAVDLDRIRTVANHLFDEPPPDMFVSEDITFATLEETVRCARTLSAVSRAVPLTEETLWRNSFGIASSLSRSKLRSQIVWLPQPPRWWDITRTVLIWVWWVLFLGAFGIPFLWDKITGDGEEGGWVLYLVFPGVLMVLLGLVAFRAERVADWIERRLERPRDRPQPVAAPGGLAAGIGVLSAGPDTPPREDTTFSHARDEAVAAHPGRVPAGPESFMVHGSSRFGFLVLWLGAVTVAAWLADEVLTVGADPLWARLPVAAFALATLFALYRAIQRGVGADPGGVTVVNFWRTYRLWWQDLREVSFHLKSTEPDEYTLEFLLTSGGSVIAAKPTVYLVGQDELRALRNRIHSAGEAALPGQLTSRQPMQGKAQVVRLHRNRLQPADVEVAITMPTAAGRYRHRRLRCRGSDLPTVMAHLFDPDAAPVLGGAEPSDHRWVRDHDFDTPDEALLAAQHQDPSAELGGWLDEATFRSKVQESGFKASLRPEAERFGILGGVVAGAVFGTIFAAGVTLYGLGVYKLAVDGGGDGDGELVLVVLVTLGIYVVAVIGIAAGWAARSAAEPFRRRNLARERDSR